MTKQEEIRLEIEQHMFLCLVSAGVRVDTDYARRLSHSRSHSLVETLDKMGVVIKVDRDFPKFYFETYKLSPEGTNTVSLAIPEEIQKEYVGCVAVEPLIKE